MSIICFQRLFMWGIEAPTMTKRQRMKLTGRCKREKWIPASWWIGQQIIAHRQNRQQQVEVPHWDTVLGNGMQPYVILDILYNWISSLYAIWCIRTAPYMWCSKNNKLCFLYLTVDLMEKTINSSEIYFNQCSSVFIAIRLRSVRIYFGNLKVQ
jgi:hypothetical protein